MLPCIYKISNPANKIYIGQTINFKRRMNNYKNYNKIRNQSAIKNSFLKYGFDNHNIEILIYTEREKLDNWEQFYIKLFNSFNSEHGLNLTSGGNTPKRLSIPKTQEWKDKISKAHKGKKRADFSQQWRDNISKSHKGKVRTEKWIENLKIAASIRKNNNGYIFTDAQKQKSKISLKIFYESPLGFELRAKQSENAKKRFSKPILQYDLNGNFIKEWRSARSVFGELGIKHPQIINCINGKAKSASGFFWKRKEMQNI